MIRVNLLKDHATGTNLATDMAMDMEPGLDIGEKPQSQAQNIIKILIILSGAALLFAYEKYNIGNLRSQNSALSSQLSQIQSEVDSKRASIEESKKLEEVLSDLKKRGESIKGLARKRLIEIRAIDYLQNVVPDGVWLKTVEFKENFVTIDGTSASDEDLGMFTQSMDAWRGFNNVILLQAIDEQGPTATVKNFKITANLTVGGS